MAKTSKKDWRNVPIEEWTVSTFHAYLIEMNKEKYRTEYMPFGKGAIRQRWGTEQGQLKTAQGKYSNELLKRFIDRCFETHRTNPKYPCLPFGFMWAYKRDELNRAIKDVEERKVKESAEVASDNEIEVDLDDWL